MTYDEIIKALECCGSSAADSCLKCPLSDEPVQHCFRVLCAESVKLIKRQNKRVTELEESELFREANDY